MAMECKQVTALIILDLSAVFDTVNYKVLFQRLEKRVGIIGKALQWFAWYLSNISQSVRIGDNRSRPTILKCGVPQRSPLGPFLFNVYTLPIVDIIRSHGLSFHIYVDENDNYYHLNQRTVIKTLSNLETVLLIWEFGWKRTSSCKMKTRLFLLFWYTTTMCKTRTTSAGSRRECCWSK